MRVLLLNQCFYPDHVATAQHLTDLALGLKGAGHDVTVVASSRGYDNPQNRYASHESWQGIQIHRIWTPGLGKTAKWRRLVDFACFWLSATLILLRLQRFDVTVCLTSPPLISTLGSIVALFKGGEVVPWVMDLNPDEAVAAGWLRAGGLAERILSGLQNWGFRRAARIVALDRFMAARLMAKGVPAEVIHTDPPWSHDEKVRYDALAREDFRAQHGLSGKFIVMYSGNHSPCHPLDTLLEAAKELREDGHVHFLFVGGGSEFEKVKLYRERHHLENITTLPYQPMDRLAGSLSAADLHSVVLGEAFVGIVHPCKIYNILTLGIPFLAIGPVESHLSDLADRLPRGETFRADHGDVPAVVKILKIMSQREQSVPSVRAQELALKYSMEVLRSRLIQVIEAASVVK
ncbi:glycosyltransferase involved in cell wall biosynthesis [Prosthecobacter fusiformis]|uniref:Glycosyltransferase involved in cell wall biosynthesis n=1 Tax=Prosthecobacter fusiformis TaxID=48464 RepID=A0A4R7RLK2_9BACT|nr:glycosyltransferase family 4 protein [Prosthecobacter fusiformis]TDU64646.1 glycosyltransferase involved in cell wall biosynthesis [Prosthecobacter fusiformis]